MTVSYIVRTGLINISHFTPHFKIKALVSYKRPPALFAS